MVHLMLVLIVVGALLYLANRFIPMDAKIKTIMNWVVVIAVILWLLSVFGILNMADIPVGHTHH